MVNFRKWLGKKESEDTSYQDLTLELMTVGFLVDYDLETWEVIGVNVYDYDGFQTQEWELRCNNEMRFLERAEDDGQIEWTLTRRVPLGEVEGDVAGAILDGGDPPEVVTYKDRAYNAVESSTGIRRPFDDGGGEEEVGDDDEGGEFVSWSYEGEDRRVLYVLQRGEREFVAYEGEYVEEYQFTEILPAPETG